ncbi:MAG: FAD-dependent oxidoreductase [Mesorhizobium sp.]
MTVLAPPAEGFDVSVPLLIVGAGGAGLCAALAAADLGVECMILERDKRPGGNTALSTGLIPGAGTGMQKAAGIDDAPDIFLADVVKKTHDGVDMAVARRLTDESAATIEWLVDRHGIGLTLLPDLHYPGHSRPRMHGTVNRNGAELHDELMAAVSRAGVEIVTEARVTRLYAAEDGTIRGVEITRPDGTLEQLGCDAVLLACNGFGGNRDLIRQYIPSLDGVQYLGHPSNQGEAALFGEALGAKLEDMGAFQGHGSINLVSGQPMWNCMTINGIQVNLSGERFSNEAQGYSEQALRVLGQPEGVAFGIFDQRGHDLGLDTLEYRQGVKIGAVKRAETVEEMAAMTGLPVEALTATIADVVGLAKGGGTCRFGRKFANTPALEAPFYLARVTGAYFHTQGGLAVDEDARVLRPDGSAFPNLFAAGGAARGLSGPGDWGYLSGNGLWSATTLGRLGGTAAARQI